VGGISGGGRNVGAKSASKKTFRIRREGRRWKKEGGEGRFPHLDTPSGNRKKEGLKLPVGGVPFRRDKRKGLTNVRSVYERGRTSGEGRRGGRLTKREYTKD